jgi:hypothetical protein
VDPETKEQVVMSLKASLGAMVGRPIGDEDLQAYYGYMRYRTEAKKIILPDEPEVEVIGPNEALCQWVEEIKKGNDLSRFIATGKAMLEEDE